MKLFVFPALFVVGLIAAGLAGLPTVGSAAKPGDLFVTNLATNTVDVYAPDGTKSVFATRFMSPQGLAFDRDHNLYVADSGSGTIYKYDQAGQQTVFYSGLVEPIGLAVDGKVLLVVEHGMNRILTIPLLGGAAKVFVSGSDSLFAVAVAHDVRFYLDDVALYGVSVADNREDIWPFGPYVTGMTAFRGDGECLTCLLDQKIIAFVATNDGMIWEADRKAHSIINIIHDIKGGAAGMAVLPAHFSGDEYPEVYVAERGTGSILKCPIAFAPKVTFVSDAGIPNFLAFYE